MAVSSTTTRSMGSGERKRCSNMAPVRRLRSLAWIKARRLPGVRCSTEKTACSSLLCLMIMPGRICVAGIAIKGRTPCFKLLGILQQIPSLDAGYCKACGGNTPTPDFSRGKGCGAWVAGLLSPEEPREEAADAMEESTLFLHCRL